MLGNRSSTISSGSDITALEPAYKVGRSISGLSQDEISPLPPHSPRYALIKASSWLPSITKQTETCISAIFLMKFSWLWHHLYLARILAFVPIQKRSFSNVYLKWFIGYGITDIEICLGQWHGRHIAMMSLLTLLFFCHHHRVLFWLHRFLPQCKPPGGDGMPVRRKTHQCSAIISDAEVQNDPGTVCKINCHLGKSNNSSFYHFEAEAKVSDFDQWNSENYLVYLVVI